MYSSLVAYILWLLCFVGLCGIHRLYCGKPLSGIIWLFTFGLLGFGQLIDLLLIPSMIADANRWGRNNNTNVNTNVINVHVGNPNSGRRRRPDDFDFDDDDEDDRPRRRRRR